MVLARVLVNWKVQWPPSRTYQVLLPCSWGPTRAFLHDCLGLLTAWQLNSKTIFQDAKAETAGLLRPRLRIYTVSFPPHSVDQGQA